MDAFLSRRLVRDDAGEQGCEIGIFFAESNLICSASYAAFRKIPASYRNKPSLKRNDCTSFTALILE